MIHDHALLDQLSELAAEAFSGTVYRATRVNREALADSRSGGRWASRDQVAVLYTSLEPEGALAEISFHWSQLSPPPSKPAALHTLGVSTNHTLKLLMGNLAELGVDEHQYATARYHKTQEVGNAVAFLGYDGLLAPSARWNCENLIIFTENRSPVLNLVSTESVDWRAWARAHATR